MTFPAFIILAAPGFKLLVGHFEKSMKQCSNADLSFVTICSIECLGTDTGLGLATEWRKLMLAIDEKKLSSDKGKKEEQSKGMEQGTDTGLSLVMFSLFECKPPIR